MRYRKSLEIEQQLAEALRLVQSGRYSTPLLADALGVSIPTVSRYVTALRERGHDIRAERHAEGWRYVMATKATGKQPVGRDKQASGKKTNRPSTKKRSLEGGDAR